MEKLISILSIFIFSWLTIPAQNIKGKWYGVMNITENNQIRLVFNITENNKTYSAIMDSPDQGAKNIIVDSVTFSENNLVIKIKKLNFEYIGILSDDGAEINGSIIQGLIKNPFRLSRKEVEKKQTTQVNRPQHPKPPYPYIEENIKFRNDAENISLAGTLTLPRTKGKFPVVVLVSGSGLQNRDEELLGHKPFLVLADYLTRNGIAVLRYDDRGFAESEGNSSAATTADFASDTEAAIQYLKNRKEINTKKIGIIGHSEGGIIAFMLAAKNKDIAFIVSMAGSAMRGDSLLTLQRTEISKTAGIPHSQIESNEARMQKVYIAIKNTSDKDKLTRKLTEIFEGALPPQAIGLMAEQLHSPWMRYFLFYNPAEAIAKIKCPVLAINGSKDLQVPSKENLGNIKEISHKNGNEKVKIIEYPNLNHLFQTCATGLPNEYEKIEDTIAPQVLSDISKWILNQ